MKDKDQGLDKNAFLVGWAMRCPRCAKADLYQSYLKPADHCPACNLDYSRADAGDGAVPFVMIFSGTAGVLTGALTMFWWQASMLITIFAACAVVTGLTFYLLPRFKSILISMQYRFKAGDASALRFRDED